MWLYNGEQIASLDDVPEEYKDAVGFTYTIVCTNTGKEYIGVKKLWHSNNRKIGKKELENHPDKRTLRKYKSKKGKQKGQWIYYEERKKESDWLSYTGSNDELNQHISEGTEITKYINTFVMEESMLMYQESKELFCNGVLEHGDKYYNKHILKRFYKKNIKN